MREEWRPVKSYESLYEVSSKGRIKSLPRIVVYYKNGKRIEARRKERVSKISNSKDYVGFVLIDTEGNKKTTKLHILVCSAFHGPAPKDKPYVNHKNGRKNDNRKDNLEWVSHAENIKHAYDTNLVKNTRKGVNNGEATLTEEQVLEIADLLDTSDLTLADIAEKFSTSITIISYINIGRTWSHLTGRGKEHRRHTKKVVNCRGELFNSLVEAANKYQIDPNQVSKVCRGINRTAGSYDTGDRIKWRYYED